MVDYRKLFKSCGDNVVIEENVFIEHPERVEVGDNVHFRRNCYVMDGPELWQIGSHVQFFPGFFMQGIGERVIIGDHVTFYPNTYISSGGKGSLLEVGHHSHFAPNCVLYAAGKLKFGPYCNIAAHCVFATVGHDQVVREVPMSLTPGVSGPITLEEDIWVAANCTITANTFIARGCIIGANAVVTKDTEPMGLYAGVPARRLRDR